MPMWLWAETPPGRGRSRGITLSSRDLWPHSEIEARLKSAWVPRDPVNIHPVFTYNRYNNIIIRGKGSRNFQAKEKSTSKDMSMRDMF